MRRAVSLASLLAMLACAPAHALIKPIGLDADRLDRAAVDLRKGHAPQLAPPHGREMFRSTDHVSGGVRFLGSTAGYLSGPQRGDARDVALGWVGSHLDLLGLTPSDLATFALVNRYTAPNGVTRLIFQQRFRGIPAFDNSLRVNVARDGRIVNVGGAPRHDLTVPSIVPELTATQAVLAAAGGVRAKAKPQLKVLRAGRDARRTTLFADRSNARLTLVSTSRRSAVLAWRVWFEESSVAVWDVLVDASSGALIRKASKVKWANGKAWDFYPGAARGGQPRTVDYTQWLTSDNTLLGNNTHVYNDSQDHEDFTTDPVDPTQATMGDIVLPSEEIYPDGVLSGNWTYDFTPIPSPAGYCPETGCAWNHLVNGSWVPNRNQDGSQVFFFVNTFHDHLAAPPISFTEAAGNFQFKNYSGQGKGNDGVFASSMDSAGMAAGRPVPILFGDNANMLTRKDGEAPRMQMYLFEPIEAGDVLPYPFSDTSGGDDASVIYHEYTHGLTNRLVIDADGNGALDAAQSGAMGEAWSDFYAMDFLMAQGFFKDTPKSGELLVGEYVDGGNSLIRTEAIDCMPGAPKEDCPRKRSPLAQDGGGGYTYEDFGKIVGSAEVHGDGEIWAQTLTDLRRRLVADHGDQEGTRRAEDYVTRALTLSPDEPSMIDMRNAILQADTVAGGKDHSRLWQVFAVHGMGNSAAAADGKDTAPTAGFDLPPGLPPVDMLAPSVGIDTPAEGAVVRAEAVTASGTAIDDAGVTALAVNGVDTKHETSTWATTLTLKPGPATITVTASDIEGRSTTAVRHVTADAKRPKLRVKRRAGRVVGRVSDDVGIARVKVNGKRVRVRKGRFSVRAKGRVAKVVVHDRAGRVVKRSLR